VTLSRKHITCFIEGSRGIAVAWIASLLAVDVEISILAFLAVCSDNIWFAVASSSSIVAPQRKVRCILIEIGSRRETVAGLTVLILSNAMQSQSITMESSFAFSAVPSRGIEDASQTLAAVPVAVADGVFIHVLVAVAFLTRPHFSILAEWISEEAIIAQLASCACSSLWALCTNRTTWIAHNLYACSSLGTWTRFRCASVCYRTVVSTLGDLTVCSICIVFAWTFPCFLIASICVAIAIARDTECKRTSTIFVVVSGLTKLTELTFVPLGTSTTLNPCGLWSTSPGLRGVKSHLIKFSHPAKNICSSNLD